MQDSRGGVSQEQGGRIPSFDSPLQQKIATLLQKTKAISLGLARPFLKQCLSSCLPEQPSLSVLKQLSQELLPALYDFFPLRIMVFERKIPQEF